MAINPATIRSITQARRILAALINGTVDVKAQEYASLVDRVIQQMRRLLLSDVDMFVAEDGPGAEGMLNFGAIRQQEQLSNLLRSIRFGLSEWADSATKSAIRTAISDVVPLADTVEDEAIRSQLPRDQRDFARAALPELIEEVIGKTEDRMDGVLSPFSRQTSADINQVLIDGIALGQNPRRAARELTNRVQKQMVAYGSDALRFMRTEMLDAYRNADLAARTTNQDILRAWMWYSAGDERTCAACWAMHGTEFATTEIGPDDHPNGRCVAIPIVRPELALQGLPEIPTREQLWDRLSPAQQRQVLGPTRQFLFNTGRIGWEDMSRLRGGGDHYRPFHSARSVRDLTALAVMREPVMRGGMADHLEWDVANFPSSQQGDATQFTFLSLQYPDLTDEDNAAIRHWISAEGFQSINGILRGDPEALAHLRSVAEQLGIQNLVEYDDTKTIALIDLMMRDNPIDADQLANVGFRNEDGEDGLTVFRAFGNPNVVNRNWQVGDRYQDDGYLATTLDRNFAEDWVFQSHDLKELLGTAPDFSEPFGAVFAIEVPAGSRGMFIGGVEQQELLLARGTTLEVVGFDDNNRAIFRAISDTATIPPDGADFFSWMGDNVRPYVTAPSFDIASITDPLADQLGETAGSRLRDGLTTLKRGLHRAADEIAAPLVLEVGSNEDVPGQDVIRDYLHPMLEAGAFPNESFSGEGRAISYQPTDQGIAFTMASLQAADDIDGLGEGGNTIALIDEAGSRQALAGALNYRLEVFRDADDNVTSAFMDVMSIGSTGIVPGAGSKLMAEAIKKAAEVNAGISLVAIDDAVGFYTKIGMEEKFTGTFSYSAEEVQALAKEIR